MELMMLNLVSGTVIIALFYFFEEDLYRYLRSSDSANPEEKGAVARTLNQITIILFLWCVMIGVAVVMSVGSGNVMYALEAFYGLLNEHGIGILKIGPGTFEAAAIETRKYYSGFISIGLGIVVLVITQDARALRRELNSIKVN